MWSTPFAGRRGAGVVELLRLTGFRTYSEFVSETDPLERRLIQRSIKAWHDQRQQAAPSGSGR